MVDKLHLILYTVSTIHYSLLHWRCSDMHHENELYLGDQHEKSPVFDKIQEFVTPLRLDILRVLYNNGRQSQGELALHLSLKPTALANRLLKFDSFNPKLLEKVYEGKYCYYALSEWGQRFMDRISEAETAQVRESTALLDRQDEILFALAQSSIEELKCCFGDEWGKAFDNVLVRYMLGSKFVPDNTAKKLTNQFLKSFELLMMHQNEQMYNKALGLLDDGTASSRATDFIDDFFLPFSNVLAKMQEKNQLISIGTVLEFIFTGEKQDSIGTHLRTLDWNNSDLRKLQETVLQIKECLSGYEQEEIYDYFTVLLPDQEPWAWILSRWI